MQDQRQQQQQQQHVSDPRRHLLHLRFDFAPFRWHFLPVLFFLFCFNCSRAPELATHLAGGAD